MIFLKMYSTNLNQIKKNMFKCSFYIENKQNWTAETYDGKYFNDFIQFDLKQEILKRVIVNNISGSAWYFKRFLYLAVKVLDSQVEISN